MTQMDPSRFAVGAGRSRPPYQPKKLDCPACGGPIPMRDERSQTVVCDHCRSQVELSGAQARAIGLASDVPPGFVLPIGAAFEWNGVRYEVCGRIQKGDAGEPEEEKTYTYLLYNPTHPSLWLSCYAGRWQISRKTRVMPGGNAFQAQPGQTLQTHDGRQWQCKEVGQAQIYYVDGALPWMAQAGDVSHVAEFVAADGSGDMYEAEYSARGELEYGIGRAISTEEVEQATGGALQQAQLDATAEELEKEFGASEGKPRLGAIGCLTFLVGLLSLVTGLVFAFTGERAFSERVPADGGKVGPFEIKRANTVLDVEIDQGFRKDGWTFIEGSVLDRNEEYLFGFGEELWSESGPGWHEQKNDFDLNVTIPEKGEYYLKFKVSAGGQDSIHSGSRRAPRSAGPKVVANDMMVTVSQKRGSSLPFFIGAIVMIVLGLLLYEGATGKGRKVLSEMETD